MSSIVKFSYILLFPCLIVFACSGNGTQSKDENPTEPKEENVGGDLDESGCKASAGFQWSEVRNGCIRVFEVGIRLNPQAEGLDKTVSAFVVFRSDEEDGIAEVFLPNEKKTTQLARTSTDDEAGTWTNGTLTLTQWRGMYTLEDASKKVLYQGPAVRE